MQAEAFDRALRGLSRRVPFREFLVELVSGTRFVIEHPEALVFRNGTAIYIDTNGDLTIFNHQGVNRLSDHKPPRLRRR
ncbi:MAG: hypothetical protein JO354_11570 [Verrucomicrobia bacterium]|nr:hypothetical protein [Verrucomicrobiota bacterium]